MCVVGMCASTTEAGGDAGICALTTSKVDNNSTTEAGGDVYLDTRVDLETDPE